MKKVLFGAAAVCALLLLVLAGWVLTALTDLPDVSVLKHYRPAIASEVLDRNGAVMAQFYDRAFRVWAPISILPDRVINAVVIAEDDTFFGHRGINYKAVWDAFRTDVEKRRFARGGSTITQQMIKNVLLSKQKTLTRKIREFVLARRAEDVLTKRRILEIYLNEVEWGDGIYGIEAASRYYFDKHATELTDAEAALLAGMLPNPHYYNPFKRPDKARQRQEQVLFNMQQSKILTPEEYQRALAEPLRLRDPASHRFEFPVREGAAPPCHLEALEDVLSRFYGDVGLYRKGLVIRTTLDKRLQDSLDALDSRATGTSEETPDRVLVVKEGGDIRGMTCTTNEEQVRSFLTPFPLPGQTFDIAVLPLSEIGKKDILLPEAEAAAVSGETPTAR